MLHHRLVEAQKSAKERRYELLHLRQHHLSIYGLFWHVCAEAVLIERGAHSLDPSLVPQCHGPSRLHRLRPALPHLGLHVDLMDDLCDATVVIQPSVRLLHRVVWNMRAKLLLLEILDLIHVSLRLRVCLGLLASEEFFQ